MSNISPTYDLRREWDSELTPDRLSLTQPDISADPIGDLIHLSLTPDDRPGHETDPRDWLSLSCM